MDVSGRIRTWMPAIHAGMTKNSILCSVDERKIMTHFAAYFMLDSLAINQSIQRQNVATFDTGSQLLIGV